jgi:hypothetical protein
MSSSKSRCSRRRCSKRSGTRSIPSSSDQVISASNLDNSFPFLPSRVVCWTDCCDALASRIVVCCDALASPGPHEPTLSHVIKYL